MKILIVTVCVNYSDFLKFCFEKNKNTLQNHYYYIVTDSKDVATIEFCKSENIHCFVTDEFYSNHCSFNKARAINTLFKSNYIEYTDFEYVLLLDADCIVGNITDPRADNIIDTFINLSDKDIGSLYSCGRRIYNTLNDYNSLKFIQGGCNHIGFFQLFHKSNLFFNSKYLLEYRNASVYDCELAKTFRGKRCLPCDVDHIGPIYMNWDGRHPKSQIWG